MRRSLFALVLSAGWLFAGPVDAGFVARSIGAPNGGKLEHGLHLKLGSEIRVVAAYGAVDARFGTRELVSLLQKAAHDVRIAYPKAVLGVGDLSASTGGGLTHHASHQSGRDADLAFYMSDAKGPVVRDRFVAIGADGRVIGEPSVRFDDDKNWALVSSLIGDPSVRVTHLFVAPAIRARLLAYAAKSGVPYPTRVRAAEVLMQPTDAPLHDDHLHVRIACPSGSPGCIELAMPIKKA